MTDRLPHICFVAPTAFPILSGSTAAKTVGGAELQQAMVAKELVQRGYKVSMICLNFGQEDRCEIDGIVVYRAFRPNEGLPVVRFVWPRLTSVWNCLRRVDADIFYHRGAGMLTGVVAAYCRHYRRKSIFAMAGETKIRFRRDRWMFQYGLRNVDRIVVQNTHQQDVVRRDTGRESTLIPNYNPPVAERPPPKNGDILWVSTIRRIKRPDRFLDLAEALPDLRFTMVGGQDSLEAPLYEQIRARADELPNVGFTGFVPYAQVHRYFDNARLFVNTSESEGFPNAFLQSWSRGIPTVSFVDCGARTGDGPVGRIVGSVDAMVATVRELSADDSGREKLGQVCREYVERNHAPERIVGLYEQLFRSMHAPPGESPAARTGPLR